MAGYSFASNVNNNNSSSDNSRKSIASGQIARNLFRLGRQSTPKVIINNNKIFKKKTRHKMNIFKMEEIEKFKKMLSEHVKFTNDFETSSSISKNEMFTKDSSLFRNGSPNTISHRFSQRKSLSLVDLVKTNGFGAIPGQNHIESNNNNRKHSNDTITTIQSRLSTIENWKLPSKSIDFKSSIEHKFDLIYTPPSDKLVENNKTNLEDSQIYEKLNKVQILKNDRVSIHSSIKSMFEPWISYNFFCKFKRFIPYIQRDHEISEQAKLKEDVIELSDDKENELREVLAKNEDKLLVSAFSINIHVRDLLTLEGMTWLNDVIIDFYLNLIVSRSQQNPGKLPSVYAFNTYFYTRLAKGAAAGRWTRNMDFFSYDLLLFPIHHAAHWRLAVVDNARKSIEYYDSLGGEFHNCMDVLVKFLESESLAKKKTELDLSEWQLMYKIPDIPMQANSHDCGVFTCIYAEYISRRAPLTFTQKNIPDFRKRMMYEILHQKLLR